MTDTEVSTSEGGKAWTDRLLSAAPVILTALTGYGFVVGYLSVYSFSQTLGVPVDVLRLEFRDYLLLAGGAVLIAVLWLLAMAGVMWMAAHYPTGPVLKGSVGRKLQPILGTVGAGLLAAMLLIQIDQTVDIPISVMFVLPALGIGGLAALLGTSAGINRLLGGLATAVLLVGIAGFGFWEARESARSLLSEGGRSFSLIPVVLSPVTVEVSGSGPLIPDGSDVTLLSDNGTKAALIFDEQVHVVESDGLTYVSD